MLIFLNNDFIFISLTNDPVGNLLAVRSKLQGHIESIFKGALVYEIADQDYAYEAEIHRLDVSSVIADRIENLNNYSNNDAPTSPVAKIWESEKKFQNPAVTIPV